MQSYGIDDGLDENRQQPSHVPKHRPGRFAARAPLEAAKTRLLLARRAL
jgi:hypothetical protein